ncbi:MAG: LytR C-terminal domain-containing protein [bacterium]|nr:LytR C-terminal domain-containing protein [bacterium]
MLNTQKLLYILPDVAYIAELLPTKKPHSFSVQTFRQINGTFLDDNEFIPENVFKLFSKLEEGESYTLVLPDFLFTNTIVTVNETSDVKIKQYLKTSLLPELTLDPKTHLIETFVLTELKGSARVQLSAIEHSVLAPIRVGAHSAKVTVTSVSPISWAIKSIVSLEPSITVLQIGNTLHSALQYIGVDQTMQTTVADTKVIAETIKTLKGAEPSIQTIYLLTNDLVEKRLAELLSNTLPLQQLSSLSDDAEKMPSYVRQIIESSMRTFSIEDYPVPKFAVAAATEAEIAEYKEQLATVPQGEAMPNDDLPKPTKQAEPELAVAPEVEDAEVIEEPEEEKPVEVETEVEDTIEEVSVLKDVNISQFTPSKEPAKTVAEQPAAKDMQETIEKPIIKNKQTAAPMLKMVFITVAAFAVTVAIGIGVGLLFLKFTGSSQTETSPVVVVEEPTTTPEPTVVPTPEASPAASIDVKTFKLHVVNATTKAGYAGTIKTSLTDAKFAKVTSGNAKEEYDKPGTYLLPSVDFKENAELIKLVETATKLTITEMDEKDAEDPAKTYDAVLVLAE